MTGKLLWLAFMVLIGIIFAPRIGIMILVALFIGISDPKNPNEFLSYSNTIKKLRLISMAVYVVLSIFEILSVGSGTMSTIQGIIAIGMVLLFVRELSFNEENIE